MVTSSPTVVPTVVSMTVCHASSSIVTAVSVVRTYAASRSLSTNPSCWSVRSYVTWNANESDVASGCSHQSSPDWESAFSFIRVAMVFWVVAVVVSTYPLCTPSVATAAVSALLLKPGVTAEHVLVSMVKPAIQRELRVPFKLSTIGRLVWFIG